jgi:multidrug efflux pump subunit AcrA (membrane-fusion protein)
MAESKIAQRAAERTGGNPADDFWTGIERMLADLAAQAKADPLPDDFPARVLAWLHEVLATEAESFWQQGLHGRLRQRARRAQADTPANGAATTGQAAGDDTKREERIKSVLASGAARSAPAAVHTDAGSEAGAMPDQTWLLCPIRSETGTAAVIEILHRQHSGPNRQLAAEVLQSVAELCGDYLRRFQLQEYARERTERDELAQFNCRVHDSIDLNETAYAIVNEGRRIIGCDRLTVLACRGPACEILAISGAARWDRRSNSVMRLEELCAAVAAGGGPLASGGLAADLPPQVRIPLDAYLEAAQVREVLVLPLVRPPANDGDQPMSIGVLVVEQFSGVLTEEHRDRTAEACVACRQALDHALVVQRIPWAGLFHHRDWRSLGRRGRAALVAGFGAVALFSAACLIPADFEVEARGVLQPRSRRDVFAPDDGVVDELFVDHGTQVTKGQPLLGLRNPQLDLDLKRVWGELQAARKRLSAIETARVEGTATSGSNSVAAARLSGEDAELQELVAGLTRQHRLLEAQETELHVASPIAGQVLTWDLPQLLQSRPVHRGQALMTIADPQGPWDLELEVPDRDAGHVLEAQQAAKGTPLPVTYRMATDAGESHETTVDRVAQSIERTASGDPALRVLAGVQPDVVSNTRPGATVLAKIHCGRRSLAYVWLRDVYYAVSTRLLF